MRLTEKSFYLRFEMSPLSRRNKRLLLVVVMLRTVRFSNP